MAKSKKQAQGDRPYLVLARKYRPLRFEEVVGQEAVARTLRNAVESNRAAHAYLFAGPRGVGKTSMARILSKALNCEKGPTPDPCGACEICQSVARGQDIDVLEIDGASNRGIEEVRAIRENALYQPTRARHRIYIIDEVHMLTTQAFNALLKILEEPPAHVKFIFATTQPQSIPETIRSRCQRFDFRPLSPEAIAKKLGEICKAEGGEVEAAALEALARRARGGMRDAQSLLDQVFALGKEKASLEDVRTLLGWVSLEDLTAFADAIAAGDAAALLKRTQALLEAGQDPGEFLLQIGEYFRDLLIVKSCGAAPPVPMASGADPGRLAAQAAGFPAEDLLYMLQVAQETRRRLTRDVEGRILLEMALLRMASLKSLEPIDRALDRLDRPAASLPPPPRGGGAQPPAPPREAGRPSPRPATAEGGEAGAPAAPADAPSWAGFLEALRAKKPQLAAYLREGRLVEAGAARWVVGFPADRAFHRDQAQEAGNRAVLEKVLREAAGRAIEFSFVALDEKGGAVIEGIRDEGPASRRSRPDEEPPIVQKAKGLFRGKVVDG